MGKSPKPLRIAIVGLYGLLKDTPWEEIDALEAQGHEVTRFLTYSGFVGDMTKFDLILGPTCWLMDDDHRKYLDLAIKSARQRRYPKE